MLTKANQLRTFAMVRALKTLRVLEAALTEALVRGHQANRSSLAVALFGEAVERELLEIAQFSDVVHGYRLDWIAVFDAPGAVFARPEAPSITEEQVAGFARYVGSRVVIDRVKVLVAVNGMLPSAPVLWSTRLRQWMKWARSELERGVRHELDAGHEASLWVIETQRGLTWGEAPDRRVAQTGWFEVGAATPGGVYPRMTRSPEA